MAHKRMFSKDITGSDAFLEMPASSQALYFHLGMEADDDGFIGNPKKVMRVMGVSDDDFKILLAKRFLLSFPSGIVVVKHHRINNNWDKYNCKRTIYLEEFSQLRIKENRAYTLDETQGIPLQSGFSLDSDFRIDKNRIDKNSALEDEQRVPDEEENTPRRKPKYTNARIAFSWLPNYQKSWDKDLTQLSCGELLFERGEENVRKFVRFVKANEGNEDFNWVFVKPSDYERKWEDIKAYAKRNS